MIAGKIYCRFLPVHLYFCFASIKDQPRDSVLHILQNWDTCVVEDSKQLHLLDKILFSFVHAIKRLRLDYTI